MSYAFACAERLREPGAAGPFQCLAAPMLAFGAGALLPLLACRTYFAAHSALGDLHPALFVFAPDYLAVFGGLMPLPRGMGIAVWQWMFRMTPVSLFGLAALLLPPALGPRERRGLLHVLGVVAFAVVGVASPGEIGLGALLAGNSSVKEEALDLPGMDPPSASLPLRGGPLARLRAPPRAPDSLSRVRRVGGTRPGVVPAPGAPGRWPCA